MAIKSIYLDGMNHGTQPIPAACIKGRLLFTGSVYGIDRASGEIPDHPSKQFHFLFRNLESLLQCAGGSIGDIMKIDLRMIEAVGKEPLNEIWLETFPDIELRPARRVEYVSSLPQNLVAQCEAIALIGSAQHSSMEVLNEG